MPSGRASVRNRGRGGKDHLTASQLSSFGRERLLDLHDQFGASKYLVRGRDDLGPRCGIIIIADAGTLAGPRLNCDGMTLSHEVGDCRRYESDAKFVGFDFLWRADEHVRLRSSLRNT